MDEPGKKSKNREGRKSIIQVVSSIFHKKSPSSLSPPKSAPASSSSHTSKFSKFKLHKNKDKSKVRFLLLNFDFISSIYFCELLMCILIPVHPKDFENRVSKLLLNHIVGYISRISFVLCLFSKSVGQEIKIPKILIFNPSRYNNLENYQLFQLIVIVFKKRHFKNIQFSEL